MTNDENSNDKEPEGGAERRQAVPRLRTERINLLRHGRETPRQRMLRERVRRLMAAEVLEIR